MNSEFNTFGHKFTKNDIILNHSKNVEMVKLIIQTLDNLGYDETSSILIEESGISLENEISIRFRRSVLLGQWKKAINMLENLKISENSLNDCKLMIYEQYYIELLEMKEIENAIDILRNKIAILCQEQKKLKKLANLLLTNSKDDPYHKSSISNVSLFARKKLLNKIQTYCQPFNLLEPYKMEKLLKQAIKFQSINCNFHNEINKNFGLLTDHICNSNEIPNNCYKTLIEPKEEVWIIKFSNSGNQFAAILKNKSFLVYDFEINEMIVKLKFKKEKAHQKEINNLAWNKNDKLIATASSDFLIKIWSDSGEYISSYKGHSDIVFSIAWNHITDDLYSGGLDNHIIIWKKGVKLDIIKSKRNSDIFISPDGNLLYAVSASVFKVNIIDLKTKKTIKTIEENENISSASLSKDGKFLILNTSYRSPEIHLWSVPNCELLYIYEGHVQKNFTIKCSFGGFKETFLSSGSEDGKIRIWHKNHNKPLTILEGHFLSVNTTCWHPSGKAIMISGSDDYTIKIWISNEIMNQNNLKIEEISNQFIENFQQINEKDLLQDHTFLFNEEE